MIHRTWIKRAKHFKKIQAATQHAYISQVDAHAACQRKKARKTLAALTDYKRASRTSIVAYCTIWGICMKTDWIYRSVASVHHSEKRDNLVSRHRDTEYAYSQPIDDKARWLLIFPREEKRSQRILKRKKWARMCNRLQIIAATTHTWINNIYMKRM